MVFLLRYEPLTGCSGGNSYDAVEAGYKRAIGPRREDWMSNDDDGHAAQLL